MRLVWTLVFAAILAIAALGAWWVFAAPQPATTLTVAAGERESDSHALMREIAQVVSRHSDSLRLDVRVSRNSSEAISAVNRGSVDLAVIQANTPAYTTINLVADLYADYFLLIARELSPIEQRLNPFNRIGDLNGRRIAIPQSGTVGNLSYWSVIDHYRLAPRSFRSFAIPRERAAERLIDGTVDAIFFQSSLRDPFLLRLIQEAGLRNIGLKFIPIEQAEAMTLKRPWLEPARIVQGALDGRIPLPRTDIVTPAIHRHLVAGTAVPEDAVRELTSVIFENRLDLLMRMSLSSAIRDPRREGSASLPLHPGAASFYDRDQPSFLQENAEPMALIVTVIAMLLSALLALRRNMTARAKNRGDRYNTQLLDIAHRARATDDPSALKALETELLDLLDHVVHALDKDDVTEEAFQSFSFLWASTRDTVRERQHALAS